VLAHLFQIDTLPVRLLVSMTNRTRRIMTSFVNLFSRFLAFNNYDDMRMSCSGNQKALTRTVMVTAIKRSATALPISQSYKM
jgi:hypothetical protein